MDAVRADRAVDALTSRFGAKVVDVTQVLIDAMKAQAAEFGLDWGFVQAADAAPEGTRDADGLECSSNEACRPSRRRSPRRLSEVPDGTRPVLLTDVAPLARYGHLNILGPWADLATAARRPSGCSSRNSPGTHGALVDRRPSAAGRTRPVHAT